MDEAALLQLIDEGIQEAAYVDLIESRKVLDRLLDVRLLVTGNTPVERKESVSVRH